MAKEELQSITRRGWILTVILPFTGCVESNPDPITIDELQIINGDNDSHDVSLTVTKNDEVVYDREYHIDSRNGSEVDSVTVAEPWMDTNDELVIETNVSSFETERLSTADLAEQTDLDCTNITVWVRDDRIEILFGTTGC